MIDWFSPSASLASSLEPWQLAGRLAVSVLFGGCVAVIYRLSHGRRQADASVMVTTLTLLAVLIAMVSMVIGDSVARAFSLVGALSIVRFRTVVEDTRDTAFVIFAVIVGMAAGAGHLLVPLFGIPMVGVVAMLLSRSRPSMSEAGRAKSSLKIRLGLGQDPEQVLAGVLDRHFDDLQLVAIDTARQGSALDLNYRVHLRPSSTMTAAVTELNRVEGVQNVESRI